MANASPRHVELLLESSATKLTLAGLLLLIVASTVSAFDGSEAFERKTCAVSFEGALARYESGRLAGAYINAWNVGARISLIPFGASHTRFLNGKLDGALELGLEPVFQGFNSVHQNFAGVLAEARYHLLGLRY